MQYENLFDDDYLEIEEIARELENTPVPSGFNIISQKMKGNGHDTGSPPGNHIYKNNLFGVGNNMIHLPHGIGCHYDVNCFQCTEPSGECPGFYANNTIFSRAWDKRVLPHDYGS